MTLFGATVCAWNDDDYDCICSNIVDQDQAGALSVSFQPNRCDLVSRRSTLFYECWPSITVAW